MKVLVAGAGIGGLSAAIALKKEGHQVKCFDRVREMRPIGAAISVWSNGVKALQSFGLDPMQYSGQMDRMSYLKHDTGETLCDFPLETLYTKVKARACPIARTDLQKILYDGAGHDTVTLNKQVVDYEPTSEGINITFADGSKEEGDFLIIADGTHSKLRNKICGETIERKYVGYINFNAAVPQSVVQGKLPSTTWTQYVGEGKRVSFMPMSNERFYVFFDCVLPKGTATDPDGIKAELKSHFKDWNEVIHLTIDNMDVKSIARVEIHDTDTLPTLIDALGRAVLIGDAAHATAPDLGQGGCLAMEDAFVVANLLKKHGLSSGSPTQEQLQQVCKDYQDQRGKRVGDTVLRARKRAAITHALEGMEQTKQWYTELAKEDGSHIMEGMSKTILGAPKELDGFSKPEPVISGQPDHLLVKVADSS
ncbi:putative flavoprotein monooxygenase acting on aromatic compound [Cystobasidium minutum MCA 4210]|uniref:putative flavoprotein monooxygenase acting on aromatic compound n=1 Tax=Cystobasidium minutum MCA 4210 TaxID=1397322 RepID=UPI0034CE0906|eukprot:jgi/Rhomi1/7127/CE7126_1038